MACPTPITTRFDRRALSARISGVESHSEDSQRRFLPQRISASLPGCPRRVTRDLSENRSIRSLVLFAWCGSVNADRGTQGLANPPVEDEVGDRVEAGRLAVYDREGRAVALRELRESGGR